MPQYDVKFECGYCLFKPKFPSTLIKVGRFLRSTALGHLGFTLAEFENLIKDFGTGEQLFTAFEAKAKKMNISLDDVRGHVVVLKGQSEKACQAHFDWQPPEVSTSKIN